MWRSVQAPSGQAEALGLHSGDVIVGVQGEVCCGITGDQACDSSWWQAVQGEGAEQLKERMLGAGRPLVLQVRACSPIPPECRG